MYTRLVGGNEEDRSRSRCWGEIGKKRMGESGREPRFPSPVTFFEQHTDSVARIYPLNYPVCAF